MEYSIGKLVCYYTTVTQGADIAGSHEPVSSRAVMIIEKNSRLARYKSRNVWATEAKNGPCPALLPEQSWHISLTRLRLGAGNVGGRGDHAGRGWQVAGGGQGTLIQSSQFLKHIQNA